MSHWAQWGAITLRGKNIVPTFSTLIAKDHSILWFPCSLKFLRRRIFIVKKCGRYAFKTYCKCPHGWGSMFAISTCVTHILFVSTIWVYVLYKHQKNRGHIKIWEWRSDTVDGFLVIFKSAIPTCALKPIFSWVFMYLKYNWLQFFILAVKNKASLRFQLRLYPPEADSYLLGNHHHFQQVFMCVTSN